MSALLCVYSIVYLKNALYDIQSMIDNKIYIIHITMPRNK